MFWFKMFSGSENISFWAVQPRGVFWFPLIKLCLLFLPISAAHVLSCRAEGDGHWEPGLALMGGGLGPSRGWRQLVRMSRVHGRLGVEHDSSFRNFPVRAYPQPKGGSSSHQVVVWEPLWTLLVTCNRREMPRAWESSVWGPTCLLHAVELALLS